MHGPTSRHPSERRAAWWYRLRGYRVLARNAWAGGYELDLVVRRGRTLVFVEVKSKSGDGHGDPLEMVTPLKVERVRRAAEAWLGRNAALGGLAVRFDVVAERARQVEVVQDAF
ncbi:MAG: YraN family protein [Gaiellaceae bacterium]